MILQILTKFTILFFYFLVTKEFILINEEFFVVISFVLCFFFLFSTLSQTIAEYLFLRIKDIRKPFNDFLVKKIEQIDKQNQTLLRYKSFFNQYHDIIKYTLNVVDVRFSQANKNALFVIDYRFRLLLDDFVFTYIAYVEKIMRAFAFTAHRYFFEKLSKPIFFVRKKSGFIVSRIDVLRYGVRSDDSRRLKSFKFFKVGSAKKQLKEVHPLRVFLPVPVQKHGVWRFLIKSKKARIWFALFLGNPMLFF